MDDFLRSANDHQVQFVTTFTKALDFRITAAAINWTRAVAWLHDVPRVPARHSRFAALVPPA